MPGLRPTVVLGLGSTGLKVVEYFRQFLLEEYGTADIPIVRCIAYESDEGAQSRLGTDLRPIIVPSLPSVQRCYDSPLPQQLHQSNGYREWLPLDVLRVGDAFRKGAGGRRAAGRLILWENWEKLAKELATAYSEVIDDRAKEDTAKLLEAHYGRHHIEYDPNNIRGYADPPRVFVAGTLCGGTCSGMACDLGFLLRRLGFNDRLLIATTITYNDVALGANLKPAANCYGALRELDFYSQQMPPGSWRYTLPDGTEAAAGDFPYSIVYLASMHNGAISLKPNALAQMVAMNLFMDVVGKGWDAKAASIADLHEYMAEPQRDTAGYNRVFFSFGVGAVWYPKSKITGMAACELALDLCSAWTGGAALGPEAANRIRADVEADWRALNDGIRKSILDERLNPPMTKFRNNHREALVRNTALALSDDQSPLSTLAFELVRGAQQIDADMEKLVAYWQGWVRDRVASRLFNDYRELARIDAYWTEFKKRLGIADGPQLAADKIATVAPQPLTLMAASDEASKSLKRGLRAADGLWVYSVGQSPRVRRFYRARFVDHRIDEFDRKTKAFAEQRRQAILNAMRANDEDRTMLRQAFRVEFFKPVSTLVSGVLAALRAQVDGTRLAIGKQRDEFETLANAALVRQVFAVNETEDVLVCKEQVLQAAGGRNAARSLAWHRDRAAAQLGRIETDFQFWTELDPGKRAEILVDNFQRQGLDLMAQHPVNPQDAWIPPLLASAAPFAEPGDAYVPVPTHRPADFIVGGLPQHRLTALAEQNQAKEIYEPALQHILFVYRERRCFAADALRSFAQCELKAADHPHLTHKEASFFDWRRIENARLAEVLLEGSNLLFPEKVFDGAGQGRAFVTMLRMQPIDFQPGRPGTCERLAKEPAALKTLRDKVDDVLRGLTIGPFRQRYQDSAARVYAEKAAAPEGSPGRRRHERSEAILAAFLERVAVPIFPELKAELDADKKG